MDQLKEILKQLIKYRFWIAIGIASLLSGIAYAVGSGPIKKLADEKTKAINGAKKGVEQYANGTLPNAQYKDEVEKKKEVLSKDVDSSWKKLYARQAPLLTWPETVEERFRKWGRKWPENLDASVVQLAIIDYVHAYPKFVTKVYQTFQPYDVIEGTGIVAAPTETALLKPAPFKVDSPPDLGKVWAAQERLWIQRTLLEVVAEVNQKAKDWDSAIIKQINVLEVGNATAQDQVSIGKGNQLEEAPELTAPGVEAAPAPEESSNAMESQMRGMGGGLPGGTVDNVYYIKSEPESTQFKILPVHLAVLIEQDHIQDLLVALENSPMSIQVVEFEMAKPGARVVKPEKGENMTFGGGMMGMGGSMGMMRGKMMPGMGGMGSRMTGFGGMMPRMDDMMRSMSGPGGMGLSGAAERKGVDKRGENLAKKKEGEIKKATASVAHSIGDPYYYIVQVTVYGQARFYNPPPAEAPAEPSQAGEGATEDGEAKKGEPTKNEGDPAKADAEKAKTEAAKPEGATTEAKPDADPAKKAETPKTDAEPAKKAETPNADAEPAKKAETPKADAEPAKKAETPKADAEPAKKAETPKADAEAPKSKDAGPAPKSEPANAAPGAATPKK